jgi:hypothetical protein
VANGKEQKEWKIIFYKTETGRCPVNDFINSLAVEDREDMIQRIEELKIIGNKHNQHIYRQNMCL